MSVLGLAVLSLLYRDTAVMAAMNANAFSMTRGALIALVLLVASCYALLGKRHGNFVLFAAAVLYYGALIVQSAGLLGQAHSVFSEGGEMRLWSNIVRQSLALLFVAWATLSSKTRLYFAGGTSAS
jgi:hypothetical protein